MPRVLEADPNCGGLLALPFMDDEPGLCVSQGGTALVVGLTAENAKPGNVVKAALLSTMFNLRLGSEILDDQGFPRTQLVLTRWTDQDTRSCPSLSGRFRHFRYATR